MSPGARETPEPADHATARSGKHGCPVGTGHTQGAAEAVVQRQLDPCNADDLAAFVAAYAESVQLFRLPATVPTLVGREALQDRGRRSPSTRS